jgi:hypothetical protein
VVEEEKGEKEKKLHSFHHQSAFVSVLFFSFSTPLLRIKTSSFQVETPSCE